MASGRGGRVEGWTLLCRLSGWPLKLDQDSKVGEFTVRSGGAERLPLCPVGVHCAVLVHGALRYRRSGAAVGFEHLRENSGRPPCHRRKARHRHPSETPHGITVGWNLSTRNHRRPARGLVYCVRPVIRFPGLNKFLSANEMAGTQPPGPRTTPTTVVTRCPVPGTRPAWMHTAPWPNPRVQQ